VGSDKRHKGDPWKSWYFEVGAVEVTQNSAEFRGYNMLNYLWRFLVSSKVYPELRI
jgi:hypothetical protein